MLILSWNVAGLSTTIEKIVQHYSGGDGDDDGDDGETGRRRKGPSAAAIGGFFRRHKADIVCLQEAKIPKASLENRSEPRGCAHVPGYESFWGCCTDSSKRGFNGVVTYCRTGTVVSADSRPLRSPELDDQGRCVMTDHGSFVLFNVYVPAGGGQPLGYKMRFLNGLRNAMKRQREQHDKRVILVGDLNITHTARDQFWGSRKLNIDRIREDVRRDVPETTRGNPVSSSSSSSSSLPGWKHELANKWPEIEAVLKSKHPRMVVTTNPRTNEKFEKYRMAVDVGGKRILLGDHEDKPERCEDSFDFDPCYYSCPDTSERILVREGNLVPVATVAELMLKLGRIEWDQNLLKSIASTDGTVGRAFPPRKWLNEIIETDKMIDCFRRFYPTAEGRFTCWEQFRNKRYVNQGARIDFTLVDESLSGYLRKGEVGSLRCGGEDPSGDQQQQQPHDAESETAALRAATANGMYRPASFAGGGILDAPRRTLDTQFGTPHTGHVYTPPGFSDHIAVSVLLDDGIRCPRNPELRDNDKPTRAAQPHKKVRPIHSYFAAPGSSGNGGGTKDRRKIPTGTVSRDTAAKHSKRRATKKKTGPLHAFFRAKPKTDPSVKTERVSKR